MTNDSNAIELLSTAFKELTGSTPSAVTPLKPHASERRIFRLSTGTLNTPQSINIIGVINSNRAENEAFVYFARHFRSLGLSVPEIYLYKSELNLYLEEDLGDETLFDLLTKERAQSSNPSSLEVPQGSLEIYRQALSELPRFQILGGKTLDFTKCYPESDLLPGTFAGDCANFSTELVLRLLPDFDISKLTADFARLIDLLDGATGGYFVYRDFQSRNIMHHRSRPYFIDFQSARRGPLQYDVVSLLYQSSTKLPQDLRYNLLDHYLDSLSLHTSSVTLDRSRFHRYFSGFIVSRMVQVLGVYGYQGLGAGKAYFASSIPSAAQTLLNELTRGELAIKLDALRECSARLVEVCE
jgi:aminoglycoside/choline kinase family phosphotransferase